MRPVPAVCVLLCCLGVGSAADGTAPAAPPAVPAAASEADAALLAAARAADLVYQRHLESLLVRLDDGDVAVRCTAIRDLGRLLDPSIQGRLLPFLDHFNRTPQEVIAAAESAGDLGMIVAVPALQKLLTHKDEKVRSTAQKNLVRLQAMGPGLSLARIKDADDGIRGPAVADVGTAKHAEAAAALIQALRYDSREYIRRQAALSLAKLGDRSHSGALVEALCDADPAVRRFAADGLAFLGAVDAVPHLLMALEANVAGAAIDRAVRHLTQQDFGFDARANAIERAAAVERGFSWWAANGAALVAGAK